jgi:quinol-cytochrome oxidoreductase complex cytochrome b subunit
MAAKPTQKEQLQQAILYPIDWLEERSGLVGGIKYFLFRKVPGDINWFQTLGSATLTAFIVQALTGSILAMYYKPDPQNAYSSIQHITNDVFAGWLVRGMHRWGASVFIILMFMHMGRVFLFGAYKYPRELNWIIGVLLLAMGLGEGFTGYLLPWDQTAYWATVVGINLNGTAPFLGPFIAQFLQGGTYIGDDTLSRFYAIHMLMIPGAIFALIGLHLYLVIRLGVTSPPWSKEAAGTGSIIKRVRRGRSGMTRPGPRLPAVQGGRQGAREAVLSVRDAARHDHVARRRERDHRPCDRLEVHDPG